MEKIKGGAPENAEIINPELQNEIDIAERLLSDLEIQSYDSTYFYEDLQFEEMKEQFSLEYDHFINIEIWSVRKMLPDEYYDQRGIVMILYLYAFISRNADYFNNLYGFKKDEIAKALFAYIQSSNGWNNIDDVLKTYLENLELPDDHAEIMTEYENWVNIIG